MEPAPPTARTRMPSERVRPWGGSWPSPRSTAASRETTRWAPDIGPNLPSQARRRAADHCGRERLRPRRRAAPPSPL